jgi:hypothetical protein
LRVLLLDFLPPAEAESLIFNKTKNLTNPPSVEGGFFVVLLKKGWCYVSEVIAHKELRKDGRGDSVCSCGHTHPNFSGRIDVWKTVDERGRIYELYISAVTFKLCRLDGSRFWFIG